MNQALEERSDRAAAAARQWGRAHAERHGDETLAFVLDQGGRHFAQVNPGRRSRLAMVSAAAGILAIGVLAIVVLRPGSADAPTSVTDTAALPVATTPTSVAPDPTESIVGTATAAVITNDGDVVGSCEDVRLLAPVEDPVEPFTVRAGQTESGGIWISIDDAHNRRMTSACADTEPLTSAGVQAQLAWPAGDDVYIALIEPDGVERAAVPEWVNSVGGNDLPSIYSVAVIGRITPEITLPEVSDIDTPELELLRQLKDKIEQVRELHNYISTGPDALAELDGQELPTTQTPPLPSTIVPESPLAPACSRQGTGGDITDSDLNNLSAELATLSGDTVGFVVTDSRTGEEMVGGCMSAEAAIIGRTNGLSLAQVTPVRDGVFVGVAIPEGRDLAMPDDVIRSRSTESPAPTGFDLVVLDAERVAALTDAGPSVTRLQSIIANASASSTITTAGLDADLLEPA